MEIEKLKKANEIMNALHEKEHDLRGLKVLHEGKTEIIISSALEVIKVRASYGDGKHILEYMMMRTKKEIEELKEKFDRL